VHYGFSPGFYSDLLLLSSTIVIFLSGLLYVLSRHAKGLPFTGHPQFSVAVLTAFWMVFTISPEIGGDIGQEIFDANLLTLLVVLAIPVYHRIEARRRNRLIRTRPPPAPDETPVLVSQP